jgi:hypothetical protein
MENNVAMVKDLLSAGAFLDVKDQVKLFLSVQSLKSFLFLLTIILINRLVKLPSQMRLR